MFGMKFPSRMVRQHLHPCGPCDDVRDAWTPTPYEKALMWLNGSSRDRMAQRPDARRLFPGFLILALLGVIAVMVAGNPVDVLAFALASAPWALLPGALSWIVYKLAESRNGAYAAAGIAAVACSHVGLAALAFAVRWLGS